VGFSRAEFDALFIRHPGASKTKLPRAIGDEAIKQAFVISDHLTW
jgi:hypothetical protein